MKKFLDAIQDFNKTLEVYDNEFAISGTINKREKVDEICSNENIKQKRYSGVYELRGNAKINLEDYRGAIDDLNKAIELNPKNASAFYYRGLAKDNLKDYKVTVIEKC